MLITLTVLDYLLTNKTSYKTIASNLSVWTLNIVVAGIAITWVTPLYHWAYTNKLELFFTDSWQTLLLAVLTYDFLYYWFHRVSHSLSLLWAVHSVHHQTTALTPTLGVRSSAFDFAVIWLITIPMVLIGFGADDLIFALGAHGLYQVFLHNRFDRKLHGVDFIFNTPRHHTIHHGVNPQYLDKNFGSILIIWDRLFGTFVEKIENPKIGILGNNYEQDPILSNLMPLIDQKSKIVLKISSGRLSATLQIFTVIFIVSNIYLNLISNTHLFIIVMSILILSLILNLKKQADLT